MIIWPSVAGFLIQFIGMGPTLYANAVCLVIGIWGVLMMGQVRDDELDQSPPRVHRMLIEGREIEMVGWTVLLQSFDGGLPATTDP